MAKIEITRTELVWPGKYNEDGTLKGVPRVSLPFQVIETVNESRATRETQKGGTQGTLFDVYEGKEGETFEAGWRNKLIWGDNLLVMGSLLEKFAGKIDLIYIDPPFATGTDFSFTTEIGEDSLSVSKEQSVLEEKAYRDTWGSGLDSYLAMLAPRVVLFRELLSENGSLYVHLDWHVSHSVKLLLDQLFAPDAFYNEVIWPRTFPQKTRRGFSQVHDVLLAYGRSQAFKWNTLLRPLSDKHLERHYQRVDDQGRRYDVAELTGPGTRKGPSGQPWKVLRRCSNRKTLG